MQKIVQYVKNSIQSSLSDTPSSPNVPPSSSQVTVMAEIHPVPASLPPTPLPPTSDMDVPASQDFHALSSPDTGPLPSPINSVVVATLATTQSSTSPSDTDIVTTLPLYSVPHSLSSHAPLSSPLSLPMPPGFKHLRSSLPTSGLSSPIPTFITSRP